MKVCLFLAHFPPGESELVGGMATSVVGLARGLAAAGADVEVWSNRPLDGVAWPQEGWRFVSLTAAGDVGALAGPNDLVVLNGMFNVAVARLGARLRQAGIPYVVAPHDPYNDALFSAGRWRKRVYWRLVERPLMERAVAVQVLDERHGRFVRGRGIDRPIIVIPNGCDADEADRPASPLPEGEAMRFLFLGRLDVHNKGLDLLLDAFDELLGGGPVRLTLQGRRAAGLSLDGLVRGRAEVRGFDDARDGREIVSDHHVLCLPSRFEGFGMAALEAMLEARVVLVSEVAGVAPHVMAADCGVVVAPTTAGIRTGLDALVSRRAEWAAMGARGRQYALERLAWDRIGSDALAAYAALYKEVDA